jgi:hypothetical protein
MYALYIPYFIGYYQLLFDLFYLALNTMQLILNLVFSFNPSVTTPVYNEVDFVKRK